MKLCKAYDSYSSILHLRRNNLTLTLTPTLTLTLHSQPQLLAQSLVRPPVPQLVLLAAVPEFTALLALLQLLQGHIPVTTGVIAKTYQLSLSFVCELVSLVCVCELCYKSIQTGIAVRSCPIVNNSLVQEERLNLRVV
jgi:hypothetical protein